MANKIKVKEKTPCGGEYSEIFYFDENGNSVSEAEALRCVIRECDENGNLLFETWGNVEPKVQSEWLYEHSEDNSARFVLGEIVNPIGKTLLCFGVNPSAATPEKLDPTIKKIKNIAKHNGYDNWIMLNIYPQRATNPNDMHQNKNADLVAKNLLHIKRIAGKYSDVDVLFAYGNLISKRKYLKECLGEIIALLNECEIKIKVIKLTKQNNPVHPLYQSNTAKLLDYNDVLELI